MLGRKIGRRHTQLKCWIDKNVILWCSSSTYHNVMANVKNSKQNEEKKKRTKNGSNEFAKWDRINFCCSTGLWTESVAAFALLWCCCGQVIVLQRENEKECSQQEPSHMHNDYILLLWIWNDDVESLSVPFSLGVDEISMRRHADTYLTMNWKQCSFFACNGNQFLRRWSLAMAVTGGARMSFMIDHDDPDNISRLLVNAIMSTMPMATPNKLS